MNQSKVNITIPKQNIPNSKHMKNPIILCVLVCKMLIRIIRGGNLEKI